jgi:hypothetical protein
MNDIITMEESSRLVELEKQIKRGLDTFVEVGEALLEIRDSRLYRIEHGTFEEYCRDKWGMSKPYAIQMIAASKVAKNLETVAIATKPTTESQARPLTTLPADKQPEAWSRAVEIAGGDQPTAKQVQAAVFEVMPPEPISPEGPAKQKRGSYEDWRTFRDHADAISEACEAMSLLTVDHAHKTAARDLAAKLSKSLMKISNNQ